MSALFHNFESLVEGNPSAISVIDKDGEIIYSSAANTRIFGYRPAELFGQNYVEFIHPEDRESSSGLLREMTAKKSNPSRWELRIRHRNGYHRWVEMSASRLLLDRDVQTIAIYLRDIQDRRTAAEQHRLQTDAMSRSNVRMEEFAYTVAHDLREPLRAMSVYSQVLLQKVQMDGEAANLAKFIFDGAARMSNLVRDLLSFTSTGAHAAPRMVDLQHAVEKALENLVLEIAESGAMVTVGKLPIVCTDETHLVMLFQNLVSNAIKYRSREPSTIHLCAEQDETHWVIKVKDNGVGIAAEHQSRVFMPFIRLANRDIPGTGLGLAVCKRIVEGFGGRIWVESEPGLGSTFAFTIASSANDSDLGLPNSRVAMV